MNLPDDILVQLKKLAAERGATLTALIEEALRGALARRRGRPRPGRIKLATYGRGGLQPGVDLDDTASLLDLMQGSDAPS